jgi:hypothetical protein
VVEVEAVVVEAVVVAVEAEEVVGTYHSIHEVEPMKKLRLELPRLDACHTVQLDLLIHHHLEVLQRHL